MYKSSPNMSHPKDSNASVSSYFEQDADTSRTSPETVSRPRFFAARKPWVNICSTDRPIFHAENLIGGPPQRMKKAIKEKAVRCQYVLDKVKYVLNQMMNQYFRGMDKEEFAKETVHYRIENIPEVPVPTKELFEKQSNTVTALREAYKYMIYYKVALNMVSCDQILYPDGTSEITMALETYHMKVICDMEMYFEALRKFPPSKWKIYAYQLMMVAPESKIARIMRHYLIIRDYEKVMTYVEAMYNYLHDKAQY